MATTKISLVHLIMNKRAIEKSVVLFLLRAFSTYFTEEKNAERIFLIMKKKCLILFLTILTASSLVVGCGKEKEEPVAETKAIEEKAEEIDEEPVETVEEAQKEEIEEEAAKTGVYSFKGLNKIGVIADFASVKNMPDEIGEIVGNLNEDDEIEITGVCNSTGWYRFNFEDGEAYINPKYVDFKDLDESEEKPEENKGELIEEEVIDDRPNLTGADDSFAGADVAITGANEIEYTGVLNDLYPQTPIMYQGEPSYEQSVIVRTNNYRAQLNFSQLEYDEALSKIALERCNDMIQNNYFSHYKNDEAVVFTLGDMYGVFVSGENIGHFSDRNEDIGIAMTEMWYESPVHKEVMTDPTFTKIGVAMVKSPSNEWYGCQLFR